MVCFIEDPPVARNVLKPEYFAKLAKFEEDNFWFRARNRLIQWALGNYFPAPRSFFEVGFGFVLKGIREASPRVRSAGSQIFGDGLASAWARLAGVDLYQIDARQIPFDCEFDVIRTFDVLATRDGTRKISVTLSALCVEKESGRGHFCTLANSDHPHIHMTLGGQGAMNLRGHPAPSRETPGPCTRRGLARSNLT